LLTSQRPCPRRRSCHTLSTRSRAASRLELTASDHRAARAAPQPRAPSSLSPYTLGASLWQHSGRQRLLSDVAAPAAPRARQPICHLLTSRRPCPRRRSCHTLSTRSESPLGSNLRPATTAQPVLHRSHERLRR
jgi:hypothetical protein